MYIMNPIGVLTHHCSKIIEVSDPSELSLNYGLSHQKKIRRPNHNHQDMLHDCAMKTMANRATLLPIGHFLKSTASTI